MDGPPGFLRVEKPGERVHYLTIPGDGQTPRKLNTRSQVISYLEKEGIRGLVPTDFDFTKRKRKSCPSVPPDKAAGGKQVRLSDIFKGDNDEVRMTDDEDDDDGHGDDKTGAGGGDRSSIPQDSSRFILNNLVRSGIKVDHNKVLKDTASMLDTFRLRENEPEFEEARLAMLKLDLSNATSVQEMVATIGTSEEGLQAMAQRVEDRCFEELVTLSAKEGPLPLADWPNSTSENWFSEVIKFGLRNSPVTLSLVLRMAVKDLETNIQPR